MAKAQEQQTRLEILMDELDRARETVDGHETARYRIMNWGSALMLVLLILAYRTDFTIAALTLPFVAIYLVVQYGYLTGLAAHGRILTAGLESRINQDLGEEVIIAESLAAEHVSPADKPNFLGVSFGNISNIFSATTLHYLVVCFVMFIGGALRTKYILANEALRPVGALAEVYFHLLILWAIINIGYLVWYFLMSDTQKKLAAAVRKRLAPKE